MWQTTHSLPHSLTFLADEQHLSSETVSSSPGVSLPGVPGCQWVGRKSRRHDQPGRWTVLIQQHIPSGEMSGYPCRYYGWWNEAHPFLAAWRMTCGNEGLHAHKLPLINRSEWTPESQSPVFQWVTSITFLLTVIQTLITFAFSPAGNAITTQGGRECRC